MMLEEFEKRTGFYPTLAQYAAIERAYMEFDGDKDAFCKAYKKNADGMAERIQREVNLDTIKRDREQADELTRRDAEIERHRQLRRTGKKIDRRPIYCATDYHYIRFNVGRGQWQWEAWNGQIRPFWD